MDLLLGSSGGSVAASLVPPGAARIGRLPGATGKISRVTIRTYVLASFEHLPYRRTCVRTNVCSNGPAKLSEVADRHRSARSNTAGVATTVRPPGRALPRKRLNDERTESVSPPRSTPAPPFAWSRPVRVPEEVAQRPSRRAAALPHRLTRRGRTVLVLAFLAIALGLMIPFGGWATATLTGGTPDPVRVVEVQPGQTLYDIAGQVAKPGHIREMVYRIEELNSLPVGHHLRGPEARHPRGLSTAASPRPQTCRRFPSTRVVGAGEEMGWDLLQGPTPFVCPGARRPHVTRSCSDAEQVVLRVRTVENTALRAGSALRPGSALAEQELRGRVRRHHGRLERRAAGRSARTCGSPAASPRP